MNQWVIFIKVLPHQDVGVVSISLIDFCQKFSLYAQFNLKVLLMQLNKTKKDLFYKGIKFVLIKLVVFLLQ
jgi:hypothetical protein